MQDHVEQSNDPFQPNSFAKGRRVPPRGRSHNPGAHYMHDFKKGRPRPEVVGYPEENLQLVPCRWSHTGWKYVQSDPAKTQFFSSPNRVNSFGFKNKPKGKRPNHSVSGKENMFLNESEFQTSYSRFFNTSTQYDSQGWKQKFNNADFNSKQKMEALKKNRPLIQWAGGLHQRNDFNKKRDQLGNWIEVLFNH